MSELPEEQSRSPEELATFQDWKGMSGATAWHLIWRHAENWTETGIMMDCWLAANSAPPSNDNQPQSPAS
jgi:hypothetical protein